MIDDNFHYFGGLPKIAPDMDFPLREFDILGVFVAPAAVMLVICVLVFFIMRRTLNQFVDVNRYVWRRGLFDVACFVLLYCIAILTMRMR